MRRFASLFMIIVFLLSGCSFRMPKPGVVVINKWTVKDRYASKRDTKKLPYLTWWQGFNDPTLNALIEKGLKCNNSMNMSRGSVEAAAGELKKIRYQWIPTVDLKGGYSNNPATGFPGMVALIIPSYVLNIFQQIREQQYATFTLAQAKADDDAVKLTVISQIAASYFTYQAEVERKKLLQTLADDIVELAEIAKKVYKDGISSDIPLEESYSEVNQILAELEVINQNIVVSRNAIHFLINEIPGKLKTTRLFADLHNPRLVPSSLPLTVLENRPDLQAAKHRLQATSIGISLAATEWLPSIQLDLLGGFKAGNNQYTTPTHRVDFNDQLINAPFLRLSVLGDIARARGINKISYYNYLNTLQLALRDATDALSAHDRFTNKLKETTSAKDHLANVYDLHVSLYKRGIETYVDTLRSKIFLDRIKISLNKDKLRELLSIVNLYQQLAGGYKADEETPKCVIPKIVMLHQGNGVKLRTLSFLRRQESIVQTKSSANLLNGSLPSQG